MRALFEEIDTDASGRIDSTELHEALRDHGAPPKLLPGSVAVVEMPKRREPSRTGTIEERRALHALKRHLHGQLYARTHTHSCTHSLTM